MSSEILIRVATSIAGWCVQFSYEDGNVIRYAYCGSKVNAETLATACREDPKFLADTFKYAERV